MPSTPYSKARRSLKSVFDRICDDRRSLESVVSELNLDEEFLDGEVAGDRL